MNRTASGNCSSVAALVDAERERVRSVMTTVLFGREGTNSRSARIVHNGFFVEVSSNMPDLSAMGSPDQVWVFFVV